MKLRLPNVLRKLVLTGAIIATIPTAFALDWEWDPIWFEQGSKAGPKPSDVKGLDMGDPHGIYLSCEGYSEYTTAGEDRSCTAAYIYGGEYRANTNTNICGGKDSSLDIDLNVETDVWLYITTPTFIVAGGNICADQYTGSSAFTGDTHIMVDADALLIFGGNMLDTKGQGLNHETVFIGNTYLSVRADAPEGMIAGGSLISVGYNTWRDTQTHVFKSVGNSYVNIYNVQSPAVTITEDGKIIMEGQVMTSPDWPGEYRSALMLLSVYGIVCGGNITVSSVTEPSIFQFVTTYEFTGSSNVVINLDGKEGLFEKRVYGGDFLHSYRQTTVREGDTSVTIVGAKDVIFTDRVVGGSSGWVSSIATFKGSTKLSIDSGTYRHHVIGGVSTGEVLRGDWGTAGYIRLTESSHVEISGGTFEGHTYKFRDTEKKEDEGKTLGAVALVGGNAVFGNIERDAINLIEKNTDVRIVGGKFSGHVVASTAIEGETEDISGIAMHVKGSSSLTMNGTAEVTNSTARVVGGMMLHTTQADYYPSMEEILAAMNSGMPPDELEELLLTHPSAEYWQRNYWDVLIYSWGNFGGASEDEIKWMDEWYERCMNVGIDAEVGVSLGGAEVKILSGAKVYDVVGGSWVASPEVPGGVVKQGDIKVELGKGATVKGNVYAAGIQAGEAPIQTTNTEVDIQSGVNFVREDGALTVVSGGYLCADAQKSELHADVWSNWRTTPSIVTGKRMLKFSSEEDYQKSLENVVFTNFDEVNVAAGDVKLRALLLTDAQGHEEIKITGKGQLTLVPEKIEIKTVDKQDDEFAETTQTLPNLAPVHVQGATLHLTPVAENTGASYIERVSASAGGVVHVDVAPESGRNALYVLGGISIGKEGTLLLTTNLTTDMADAANAAICKMSAGDGVDTHAGNKTPTVNFTDGGKFDLNLRNVADSLKQQDELRIVLIDQVKGDYSITANTKERLARAFDSVYGYDKDTVDSTTWDGKHLWIGVDEEEAMVIRAKTGSEEPEEPDYNPTPIPPVLVPVPVEPQPTPIPPVLEPVPVPEKPTPEPPAPEPPTPTPDTHYHRRHANTPNGFAGGDLMDEYFDNTTGENKNDDREKVLERIIDLNAEDRYAESDRLQAAVAGSSISVLALAAADDVERQMRLMRNRSGKSLTQELTRMRQRQEDGGKAGIRIHEYPEAVPAKKLSFWINAEGEHNRMQERSTDPGFRLNSWGGTVGAAATLSRNIEAGLAVTAMYGDLQSKGPDSLKGDMDTGYLSTFVRVESGRWSHTFVATVGLVDMDGTRSVNIGGEYGGYATHYDTDGYALGLMYEAAYTVAGNRDKTSLYQAVANIAWRHVSLNGFTETGDTAAKLRAGEQKVDSLILGLGGRAQWLVGGDMFNRGSVLELRVLGKGYTGDLRNRVNVGFADRDHTATVRSRKQGALGAEIGAGYTLPLGSGTGEYEHSLFIDVNYELRRACGDMNATLGYKLGF